MANERKKLPALDNAAKVKKPDLPDIADKNYTDKILKYGGLATRFPQLNTNAKTVVAAINELQAGGSGDGKHRTLTQAEYDELTPEEKMDGTIYFIIDAEGPSGGVTKLNELEDVMPPTTNDNGALLAWSTSNEMWECVVPDSAENGYILVWNEDDGQWSIGPLSPDYIRSDNVFPINGNIAFSTENGNYVETTFPTLNPGAIMFWNYESQTWDVSNFEDLQQGDTIVWNGESSWINVPSGGTPIIEHLESEDVYSPGDGTIIQYNYSNSQWIVNTAIENLSHGQALMWDANYGMWRNRITFDDEYTDNGYVFAYDYDSEKWVSRRLNLYELGDCLFDSTSPQEGDVLTYTLYNGEYIWMPQPASGGGASELQDLDDVDISSPTTNQVLTYQDGYWINADASGGASALDDLNDVDITYAQSGQVLKYNGYEWVNANESTGSTVSVTQIQSTGTKIATITVDSVGTDLYAPNGGGGATALDNLTDVSITSVTDGQVLTYDSNSGEWVNDTISVTVDAEDVDYDNTTSGLTADDVQEAIDEVVDNLDDKAEYVELTQLEYDALSPAEKNNGTLYFITDANGDGEQFQPIICAETEREIGVFTDGKPLYQRTYNWTGSCNSGSYQVLDASFTNSEYFTAIDIKTTTNKYADYIFSNSISGKNVEVGTSTSLGLYFENFTSYTVTSISATIRYTKTTDTAGSGTWTPQGVPAIHYSENEQIIGTWIDGSPLYERSYVISHSSFTTGWKWFSLGVVCDRLVDAEIELKDSQATYCYTGIPVAIQYSDGAIGIFNNMGGTMGSVSGYVTLRYTKSSS